MRIVARSHAYPPAWNAGGEVSLHAFLRALVARGHEVTVGLTWDTHRRPERYLLDGVQVVPKRAGGDHPRLVAGADVIVTHDVAAPATAAIARAQHVPMVLLFNSYCGRITSDVNLPAALRVFCSQNLRENLGDPAGIVIRPPVDPEYYRTTPGEHVTLVNLSANKGADVFGDLARRMPDVQFLGVRGSYGRQVTYNRPNVTIVDHTPDMRLIYGETRLLLMPSIRETWGRVAVEAMCSGIPVIATDDAWSRESIADAGILLPRTDLDAWETAIRALLDPDTYTAAQATARRRAAELDPTADLEAFVAAVEALADGRAAA